VAALVEHVVGGKQGLRADGAALSTGKQDGRILEPGTPGPLVRDDHSEHDRNAPGHRKERVEFAKLIANEVISFQQVHRRVTGQYHLGQYHQVCAFADRLGGGFFDEPTVAGQIADRGIYLSDGQPHHRRIGGAFVVVKAVI
jgi:hypothetical protein